MEKLIVFLLSALIFFSPMFSGPGNNEGIGGAEALLQSEVSRICLSFEHYKMQDGWTPVVLSMGEINCLLWMDETGRVSELREPGAPFVEPVCLIDVSTQSLWKEADALYFDVYEQNSMRTRWRLSPGGTAGTVTKKILFREKSGVDLCLGTLRLQLKHVAWDIKEFSPGLFHVQFHGPTIAMHQSLVYEKAAGIIYSIHEWNNKYAREKSFIQTAKPGKPSVAAIPSQERAALIALYNSTNGDNWRYNHGWKTPPLAGDGFALPGTENSWVGISCDAGNTKVLHISLSYNNLVGTLPSELGNLANLQELYLFENQISGSIPPELGNLANLRNLDLFENQLSGSIPPELGNLPNLYVLALFSNQLSGTIPPELGNLSNLYYLYLNANQLSGSIPPELGNLGLSYLDLSSNQLSGTIPTALGNLPYYIIDLNLSSNQLSGTIPLELENLRWLNKLDLSSNLICGIIPSNFINLTDLVDLDLRWNALYTNDIILKDFLNSKQDGGDWESTQTIAATNKTATAISTTTIDIKWTPIIYTSDTGGYRVFYSTIHEGPYTYFGMTPDKLVSSLTVTDLNPDTLYYFVIQARTYPHYYNQNTVDSEYSAEVSASTLNPLILASPNGGESWCINIIRNITWSTSGLSGNIRLELWKADKKLGALAANIPIGNGNYTWFVGNCGPGIASPGNDYKVKIITANGLYNDASNATFSIVQPSLTLTSPRGGTNWNLGTLQNITWTWAGLTGNVKLLLFKDGVQVGVIARGIPIANGTYAWTVGKHFGGMAPVGSNYSVKIRSEDNSFYNSGSGAFKLQ